MGKLAHFMSTSLICFSFCLVAAIASDASSRQLLGSSNSCGGSGGSRSVPTELQPDPSWTLASLEADMPIDNKRAGENGGLLLNNHDGSFSVCDLTGDKSTWIQGDSTRGALTVKGIDTNERIGFVSAKHVYWLELYRKRHSTTNQPIGSSFKASTRVSSKINQPTTTHVLGTATFELTTGGTATCPLFTTSTPMHSNFGSCVISQKFGEDTLRKPPVTTLTWTFVKLTACLVPDTKSTACCNARSTCAVKKIIFSCKKEYMGDDNRTLACSEADLEDTQIHS